MPDITIDSRALANFCEAILCKAGVPSAIAALTAESLVASNLRGVDSHGVQLLPYYVKQILGGDLNPATNGRVISE
ncbi:MAG: Ldh family oxidoreductase, partial [Acidobacteriota bacterium]|nr:Ldh family oxidoreductase [Acidobacteriota bacterium]